MNSPIVYDTIIIVCLVSIGAMLVAFAVLMHKNF